VPSPTLGKNPFSCDSEVANDKKVTQDDRKCHRSMELSLDRLRAILFQAKTEAAPSDCPEVEFVHGIFGGAPRQRRPSELDQSPADPVQEDPEDKDKKDPLEALRLINEARRARGQLPPDATQGPVRGVVQPGAAGPYQRPGIGLPTGPYPGLPGRLPGRPGGYPPGFIHPHAGPSDASRTVGGVARRRYGEPHGSEEEDHF
jgi:hypothetical protein